MTCRCRPEQPPQVHRLRGRRGCRLLQQRHGTIGVGYRHTMLLASVVYTIGQATLLYATDRETIHQTISNFNTNVCLINSAESSPLDRSKRFTLHSLACSFRHQLYFSEKHSRHAATPSEHFSLTCPPPSIARYSFILLIELGRRGENENAQAWKQQQRGFEPRISRL